MDPLQDALAHVTRRPMSGDIGSGGRDTELAAASKRVLGFE